MRSAILQSGPSQKNGPHVVGIAGWVAAQARCRYERLVGQPVSDLLEDAEREEGVRARLRYAALKKSDQQERWNKGP